VRRNPRELNHWFVADSVGQQTISAAPIFRVTSRLVYPDATALTKADFIISENEKAQPIFSFEAPNEESGCE
jgi:hypothetical protein